MQCSKAQMQAWLKKRKVAFARDETKDELFAKIELDYYGCPQSSRCGELINTMGHIFNGRGTIGGGTRGKPINGYLIPAIMEAAGSSTIFGGDLKFNAIPTGARTWKGAIVGDDTATPDELRASLDAMLHPAAHRGGSRDPIEPTTVENLVNESPEIIAALRTHWDLMHTDHDAPNYYVSVTQNVEHYNLLLLARDDDGNPIAYYYEPHDNYKSPSVELPYGMAAVALERILGDKLHYGSCGLTHQNDDWLCQSWSVWFGYLLSSGMSYEEAQQFVATEHIKGLVAFSKFCYTVPFTTRSGRLNDVTFSGSLTKGTLKGKTIRIKDLILGLPRTYKKLESIGLSDAVRDDYGDFAYRTENAWRGGGHYYKDRAALL